MIPSKCFNFLSIKKLRTVMLAGSFLVFGMPTFADDALQIKLDASEIVKDEMGQLKYQAVQSADSGTLLQYKATYSNHIDQPIENIVVNLPIPENTVFTGDAYPSAAQGTIDGINFSDMPLMREVDGELVKVPYEEYQALRWNIKFLPAYKSADVTLNAIVK